MARIPNEVEEAAETDDDDTELDATELEDDAPAKQEVSLLAPTVIYGNMSGTDLFALR